MATTAKMSERAKRNLKRVQASIERKSGRTVTQQEVLERLLQRAARDPDSAMEFIAADQPNFHSEDLERMKKNQFDLGFVTREVDVDKELYGWAKKGGKRGRSP